jgi:hypothetical protein
VADIAVVAIDINLAGAKKIEMSHQPDLLGERRGALSHALILHLVAWWKIILRTLSMKISGHLGSDNRPTIRSFK